MKMIETINGIISVEEIVSINAVPAWNPSNGETRENPGMFSVSIGRFTAKGCEFEYFGEYLLDGTQETFQKAVENYNAVAMKAATTGCFNVSDFENFEVY